MTAPERVLWSHLRAGRLGGFKFRRQHPIGPYIADFYCHEAALVVETDSTWHYNERGQVRDAARDRWFDERGIRTLRVSASWLAREEGAVLGKILSAVRERVAELGDGINPKSKRGRAMNAPPPILAEPRITSPAGAGEAAISDPQSRV